MKLETGKTYLTRDGGRVTIEAETAGWTPRMGVTYRMQGIDDRERVTWRSSRGRFTAHPHRLDLVREA